MSLGKVISIALAASALALSASAALAGAAVTTAPTKLLDGPAAAAAPVTSVGPGTKVGVLWCGMGGQWCLVNFHGKQGFVALANLKMVAGKLADGSVDVASGGGGGGNNQGGGIGAGRPPETLATAPSGPMRMVGAGDGSHITINPSMAGKLSIH